MWLCFHGRQLSQNVYQYFQCEKNVNDQDISTLHSKKSVCKVIWMTVFGCNNMYSFICNGMERNKFIMNIYNEIVMDFLHVEYAVDLYSWAKQREKSKYKPPLIGININTGGGDVKNITDWILKIRNALKLWNVTLYTVRVNDACLPHHPCPGGDSIPGPSGPEASALPLSHGLNNYMYYTCSI